MTHYCLVRKYSSGLVSKHWSGIWLYIWGISTAGQTSTPLTQQLFNEIFDLFDREDYKYI